MKSLVDRPGAKILTIKSGKGSGKKVMAYPVWGEDNDSFPVSIHVIVSADLSEKLIDKIDGPFQSIEQTEELALKCASSWYERGNG